MDIAEIRKKAAAGRSDPADTTRPDQEPKVISSDPVVEPEADAQILHQASAAGDCRSEPQWSGLDKLFAQHQGFELATEETYQQTLSERDAQADEDVRE